MTWIPTGREIEAEREGLGLTTTQLAALAGLTDHSHLRKIERGEIRNPGAGTLRRIVAALKRAREEKA